MTKYVTREEFAEARKVPHKEDLPEVHLFEKWLDTKVAQSKFKRWEVLPTGVYHVTTSYSSTIRVSPGYFLVENGSGYWYASDEKVFTRKWKPLPENVEDGQDCSIVDTLLEKQREVELAWNRLPNPGDPAGVSRYIREVILCAEDELHELLAEVHWKPWKDSRGIKDIQKYREELSDVLHFILDLYLVADLTGKDLVEDYMSKHDKNLDRVASEKYRKS